MSSESPIHSYSSFSGAKNDPEEQRAEVRLLLERDGQTSVGQRWYLLSLTWWRKWKAFVRYDAAASHVLSAESPGEIDNRELLEPSGKLKQALSENVSFVFVPQSVWERLKEWYGCEPGSEIERKVVKVGSRVFIEVYPWSITLSFKDAGMLVNIPVVVSQAMTIADLESLAKERLGIDEDEDVTLWDAYNGQRTSVLLPASQIGSSLIYNGSSVIVQRGKSQPAFTYDTDSDTEAKSTNGVHDDGDSSDDFGSPPPYGRLNDGPTGQVDKENDYYSSTGKVVSSNGYTTTSSSSKYSSSVSSSRSSGVRGTVGLGNLGNTCFMNSSLQCLSNTLPLRNYFLSGEFYSEINTGNVLGTKGELVQAFGNLLRSMWNGSAGQVAPRVFKHTLGKHAEQFMGYDQHDSQELIAYLLDGIHEDVNQIEKKPFVEQVEAKEGESDESAADRAWDGHLQRNRSRIVDLFQGQFKSVVTCPVADCNRVSITFDPFMYLSVPLPFSQERELKLTYLPLEGGIPRLLSVKVAKAASVKTLMKAMYAKLGAAVGDDGLPVGVDLKVADTYQGDIYEQYELTTNLTDINDSVDLHVYELPIITSEAAAGAQDTGDLSWLPDFKRYLWAAHQFEAALGQLDTEMYSVENKLKSALDLSNLLHNTTDDQDVEFAARRAYAFDNIKTVEDRDRFLAAVEGFKAWYDWVKTDYGANWLPVLMRADTVKQYRDPYLMSSRAQRVTDAVGVPMIVGYDPAKTVLGDIVDHVARLSHRFVFEKRVDRPDDVEEQIRQTREILASECVIYVEVKRRYAAPDRHYISRADEETFTPEDIERLLATPMSQWLRRGARVVFHFSGDATPEYVDLQESKHVEEEPQAPLADKRHKANNITLYDCISSFMQKEQLEETEMWYCNQCKEHRQAWKQFFLWRTPPILVIHLKRFQYDGMFRDKLDHLVDFPLEGLDLSAHALDTRVEHDAVYDLYAVSNHYGGLGGGHYTAFCRNAEDGNWYEFDDSYVRQVPPTSVVTEAAYVLFYMRRDLFPARLRGQPGAASPRADSPVEHATPTEEDWVHVPQTDAKQAEPSEGMAPETCDALDMPLDELLEQGERALAAFKESGGEIAEPSSPVSSYRRNYGYSSYGPVYSGYL